jgi:hypothetical protein
VFDHFDTHHNATFSGRQRATLEAVAAALRSERFYAYVTLDSENRWIAACDTKEGRIDVRVGSDGLEVDTWTTSPGLFWDEEDERRRGAKERLAKVSLPAIARGFLEPSQEVWWDETDHGVGARVRHQLPFSAQDHIGQLAVVYLQELDQLLTLVEARLLD